MNFRLRPEQTLMWRYRPTQGHVSFATVGVVNYQSHPRGIRAMPWTSDKLP